MIVIPRESFTIEHFESLIANGTMRAGNNLLAHRGFELGSFYAWTNTNWNVIASDALTPNGAGAFYAQAASGSKGVVSTLESDRVAVSALNDYIASILFASPEDTPKRANNLQVLVRWWNAPSGGSNLREDTVWAAPVRAKRAGMRYAQIRLTAPSGATYASFVLLNKYGSGTSGYGVLVDNPTLAGAVTISRLSALDVWEYGGAYARFRNLKFSWDRWLGCKRMAFRVYAPTEYLWHLLHTALAQHVETHYEGERRFAGMVWSMRGMVGKRAMEVSLDSFANWILVPYKNTFVTVTNAESIQLYGRKDFWASESFDSLADARAHGDFLMDEMAFPIPTSDANGGADGEDYLDFEVMGLGATLQWVTNLPPVWRRGELDTADVIATMPRTVYGGRSLLDRVREDTPNDFISGDYALVDESGRTILPLENTERKTSQEILLDLLGRGTSSRKGIVAGVNADRKFFMARRPTTLRYYRERDADGNFSYWDSDGNEVPRPLVRCGEFFTQGHAVPNFAVTPGSDAARVPANQFIVETDYDAENNALVAHVLGKRRIGLDFARVVRVVTHTRRRVI